MMERWAGPGDSRVTDATKSAAERRRQKKHQNLEEENFFDPGLIKINGWLHISTQGNNHLNFNN